MRFRSKLLVPKINTGLARNSSQYQIISFFNNVSQLVKEEKPLPKFKRNLSHLLINKEFYKIEVFM